MILLLHEKIPIKGLKVGRFSVGSLCSVGNFDCNDKILIKGKVKPLRGSKIGMAFPPIPNLGWGATTLSLMFLFLDVLEVPGPTYY